MRVNALTTETGLKVGPVVLETLIKHYFERRKTGTTTTQLRQDELLYDEVFNVVKTFDQSHFYALPVCFANTRTPSPPSVHVVRLLVPMTSCDEAAEILITAFGGKEAAQRVVGGVKWWQVRGINGVDAQWITAKKDLETAKRRTKMKEKTKEGFSESLPATDPSTERVTDSDLYLIRPPPGAAHCPVNPAHIIVAGDSAGGGLSLALLQVIRDSGLPAPAGGVLISPWCDLTHSFSSIHTNTATDVLPEWGLSLQKPSVLWPPPPDELSKRVHASLRTRIREVFRSDQPYDPTATMLSMAQSTSAGQPVDVGTTTSLPISDSRHIDQNVSLLARSGDTLSTSNQLHLYTQNNLLTHPLVSPAMSYLGGLPPLLFIASDREVLRDEIIYTDGVIPISMRDDPFILTDPAQPPDSSGPSSLRLQEPVFQGTAGDSRIYRFSGNSWDGTMIRERISTQGIVRPLEPESELSALAIDPDIIGCMSELTLRRYLDASAMFDKKFAHTIRAIERDRKRNLKLAKKDTKRDLAALHHKLFLSEAESSSSSSSMTSRGRRAGSFTSSGSWNWAWALDGEERPPPSSIVSRRDTAEARHLAKIADEFLLQDDKALSGNRFWSAVLNFFTSDQDQLPSDTNLTKRPSRLDRFFLRERSKDISSRDSEKNEGYTVKS
ncbi:hypothetical protein C0993_006356 [Termitomyces sp. T159_Od127]|nr:hypothetical protein C0993_006356 [Termitomyces sp. T159_Od127]